MMFLNDVRIFDILRTHAQPTTVFAQGKNIPRVKPPRTGPPTMPKMPRAAWMMRKLDRMMTKNDMSRLQAGLEFYDKTRFCHILPLTNSTISPMWDSFL